MFRAARVSSDIPYMYKITRVQYEPVVRCVFFVWSVYFDEHIQPRHGPPVVTGHKAYDNDQKRENICLCRYNYVTTNAIIWCKPHTKESSTAVVLGIGSVLHPERIVNAVQYVVPTSFMFPPAEDVQELGAFGSTPTC